MGRNLYILSGTFGLLAIVGFVLSVTNFGPQMGSAGDASLWRVTAIALLCAALVCALAGVLSSLFEQAERRHEEERRKVREGRRR
jgi:Na+/melibiose symporter-like transporter